MKFSYSLFVLAYLGHAAPVWASNLAKRDISSCPGYTITSKQSTAGGFTVNLELAGAPCNIYGNDILSLNLQVTFDTQNRLHLHIQDTDRKQYQIPGTIIPLNGGGGVSKDNSNLKFDYFQDTNTGFGFRIKRDDEVIFDTSGHSLIFEDQYIEVTSSLPSSANIYGIGEAPDYFRRDTNNTIKTLWNREAAGEFGKNSYGSHTIYMELRKDKFHGAYLHNSHGMDIVLANNTIQYRILGGTADFYFFNGPSALDVINQYTELVGRPYRVPYWSLGLHNCRYGYKDIYEVNEVIANYSKANIPLEAVWSDVDYMDNARGFTFDPVNYPLDEMQKQLEQLHAHNQKRVLIVHPAIQHNVSYAPYARGDQAGVFVKNLDGSEYITQVWPGYSVLPDWFAKNADSWWGGELTRFLSELSIDGLWIDMNEPSTFCTGSCGTGRPADEVPPYPWTIPPQSHRPLNTTNKLLVPPYSIHQALVELSDSTIETTAINAQGLAEYYTHNLYGYMHSKATYKFLTQYRPNVRPFLLSPTTFAGSGKYVSHWVGDNHSNFFDLHVSIASMLDFGIFGIPMMGADICGFEDDTTEELCARWAEVGAFYPFARNHNAYGAIPQELYRWPSVAEASRRALGIRYALLPYIYTNLQLAVEKGWPLARALIFEFPGTSDAIDNDRQFLVGDSLLISPVITEGATSVDALFPQGIWYDWYTYSQIQGKNKNITLDAPLEHVNVHIRGGKILPAQVPALTTTDSRKNDFYLIVAADANNCSSGKLYYDDGETFTTDHRWIDLKYADNMLFINQIEGSYTISPPLTKILLLGVADVQTVVVNDSHVNGNITNINGASIIDELSIDLNKRTVVSFDF
ncbi:glycoside hydrolase family 31 protein [Coemansia spiralis]|nr:glycoside hydrolase family 31 protein [Coemansia spiralis]